MFKQLLYLVVLLVLFFPFNNVFSATLASYTDKDVPADADVVVIADSEDNWETKNVAIGDIGVTDLTNTPGTDTVDIESSNGEKTTLPAATTSTAGVLTSSDKTKIDNLDTAAYRAIEDTLTDGSNIPDGAAIKLYGDTNWEDIINLSYNQTSTYVTITPSNGGTPTDIPLATDSLAGLLSPAEKTAIAGLGTASTLDTGISIGNLLILYGSCTVGDGAYTDQTTCELNSGQWVATINLSDIRTILPLATSDPYDSGWVDLMEWAVKSDLENYFNLFDADRDGDFTDETWFPSAGATATFQDADPTVESATGFYGANTSGKVFLVNQGVAMWEITATRTVPAAADTTAPTVTAAIDGTTLTVTPSEEIVASTTADLCDDFTGTGSTAGALTFSYLTGDNTGQIASYTCTASTAVINGETVTWDYTPGTITDNATTPNSLVSFSGESVTNNTSTGETQIASDNFSSYTHGASLVADAAWTSLVNDMTTLNTDVVRGSTAAAFNIVYSSSLYNANQYSEVTITGNTPWSGPAARIATDQCYFVKITSSGLQAAYYNGSTDAAIGSLYSVTPASGDKVKIKVSGSGTSTRLTVAYDSGGGYSNVITDIDPGAGNYYDSGSAGIISYSNASDVITAWAGGNL